MLAAARLKHMSARRVGWIALFAGLVNLIASLALLTVLRPGTVASGTVISERMAYVASHHMTWMLGWSSCMAGTFSLVALFFGIVSLVESERLRGHLPLILVMVGAVSDTMGVSLQLFALPLLARSTDAVAPVLFDVMDGLTIAWTGGLNNLWYGVGFLALVPYLQQSKLPGRFAVLALTIGLVTLVWGAASFYGEVIWLVTTTAIGMMLFLLWTFDLGWYLIHQKNASASETK
ncbi:MAG: hypothetical protein COV75_03555 [Candidatus Omnitrophica bacterium CG11_big_fil_rev_8_21_14_0_20_63_9]|nr:MAG: hypothetical protein COV75_03555 [Candidatus Omnitrophica bacterium CG11_big_fil_rev_8_21_14_0_20_63_9]